MNRITDRCKNITSFAGGNNNIIDQYVNGTFKRNKIKCRCSRDFTSNPDSPKIKSQLFFCFIEINLNENMYRNELSCKIVYSNP